VGESITRSFVFFQIINAPPAFQNRLGRAAPSAGRARHTGRSLDGVWPPAGGAESRRARALARRGLAHIRRAGGEAGMELALVMGIRYPGQSLLPQRGRTHAK